MKENFNTAIKQISHLIDAWIPLKIKYDKVPGISMGIVYNGKLAYHRGFGFADIKKKKKADERTLYHIASISKTFTAVAILQLVERGKLRLDDKVSDYIEWFKGKNSRNRADADSITIRQLLSHASGVFRDGNTSHWDTGKFPKDLKATFSEKSLITENLTGFKYTNYGFSLLGEVIKKASGLPYEKYVIKNILRPIGMLGTVPDYRDGLRHASTGYGREIPDEARHSFKHYKTNAYAPATGLLSNVVDLSKYISALSLADRKRKRILNRESIKEMMHLHEITGKEEAYGLGLEIERMDGRKIVGHGGGFNGFTTQILWDPQNDIGVIVLSNALGGSANVIAYGIIESIYAFFDQRGQYQGKRRSYKLYEGVYRDFWSDGIVVQVGSALVGFSPKANSPLKDAFLLKQGREKHKFLFKTKNVFGPLDEPVEFGDFKNSKPQKIFVASAPSKRVKII